MSTTMTRYSCLNTQSVKISYFDPLSVFDSISEEISHILPLRDLHWKSSEESPVVTVNVLQVDFVPEGLLDKKDDTPFVQYIIIKCATIEEYRTKIRPIIRLWLSTTDEESTEVRNFVMKGILFLTSSSGTIINKNIFQSISLTDKISQDFPALSVHQLQTVYKSVLDKKTHWDQFSVFLKKAVLQVFQTRISDLNSDPNSINELAKQEQLFRLYLGFQIYGKCKWHMQRISKLSLASGSNLGDLVLPVFSADVSKPLDRSSLTFFQILRHTLFNQIATIECLYPRILLDKVKELHKVIIFDFLYEIKTHFSASKNLDLFLYYACEEILNLLIIPVMPLDPEFPNCNLWTQLVGDVMLIKRESWVNIANAHQSTIQFSNNTKQGDLSDERLEKTMNTPDQTLKTFLEITKQTIGYFTDSRKKTVDLLSLEISDAFYQCSKYPETMELLESSYEYYISNGWESIANSILIRYIRCLENIKAETVIIDDERIPVISVLANSYLNLMTNHCTLAKTEWWNKFLQLNDKAQLVYSLDSFLDIDFDDNTFLSKPNTYAMSLAVSNIKTGTDISVDSIRLLTKTTGKDQFVTFTSQNSFLKHTESNTIVLESKSAIYGEFEFISLELTVGNTIFNKEFDEKRLFLINNLYSKDSFEIIISEPLERNLESHEFQLDEVNRSLVDSYECRLDIKSPTSVVFSKTGTSVLVVTNDDAAARIRYICKGETSLMICMTQRLTFKKDGIQYSELKDIQVNHTLDISVAVEDIYKAAAFYFKFLINMTSSPVHIWETSLTGDQSCSGYDIFGGYKQSDTVSLLDIRDDDPFQSAFVIKPRENSFGTDARFVLSVSYSKFNDMLNSYLTVNHFLKNEELLPLKHIWEREIVTQFEYHKSQFYDSNIVKVSNYDIVKFEKHVRKYLSGEKCVALFLRFYDTLFDGIPVDKNFDLLETSGGVVRQLNLPIDVPPPKNSCVFSVQMSMGSDSEIKTLKLGQPYMCTFKLTKNFEYWEGKSVSVDLVTYECLLDNDSISETWLVNGLTRFSITEDKMEVPVELIPIKRGYLRLPRVEIVETNKMSKSGASSPCLVGQNQLATTPSLVELDFINSNDNIIVV